MLRLLRLDARSSPSPAIGDDGVPISSREKREAPFAPADGPGGKGALGHRVRQPGYTRAGCRYFSASTSAIWIALSAAPLRSWSPHTQKFRAFSALSSSRIRPT